ncbi:MAG TPA: Holliday junction resolvase RuvX, partial [Kiloniellales bacterium]|nr:Holliday junction resolvase RuvX [Kiloniellales bacterium]
MAIVELRALPRLLPPRSRLLGLDLGEKTIGLAIATSDLSLASPLETIQRTKFTEDAQRLADICREQRVGGLVLGLPLNMDGSEGKRARSTRQFARNLEELAGFTLPIAYWDERLSTAAIERFLVEDVDMSRRRRGQVVDKMAAAFILQGAIDALRNWNNSGPERL